MQKYINLVSHDVNLYGGGNTVLKSFPMPEKGTPLPRLESSGEYEMKNGTPIGIEKYGDIENLPPEKEGVIYIVSFLVNAAARKQGRNDTVFPAGKMHRDEKGRIIGMGFLAKSF